MKKIMLMLALAISTSVVNAADCAHPVKELGACAEVKWLLGPKYGIFSKAQVDLKTADGKAYVPSEELDFYPWMMMEGGHEHGARETVVKKLAPGSYEVAMIHLTKMPGKWFLRLKKSGAKARDEYLLSMPIDVK